MHFLSIHIYYARVNFVCVKSRVVLIPCFKGKAVFTKMEKCGF